MKHSITAIILCIISATSLRAEVTLEWCVEKAMANYPIVKKYGLLSATKEIELSDINKSWLPRADVYAQATLQNAVPSFPAYLSDIVAGMGHEIGGLDKLQYKVVADISQTVWDGGASKARREIARSKEALQNATLDVELYGVRQRVENIYFAILLTEEQIAQSRVTYNLLNDNLEKLRAMLRNGTAMQADVDMTEAQALAINQIITQATNASEGYRRTLELFTGEKIGTEKLVRPEAEMPLTADSNRPELTLFERRLDANQASQRLADRAMMPKVGFFLQTYYGYPGFDYFKSMTDKKLSFNLLGGVKVSWNLDSFYTRKNTRRKTALNANNIAADRELFLFNTEIAAAGQNAAINGLREVMKDDERIVALRGNVRRAAESQLANGVIDTTALLTKISDENMAQLTAIYHRIQLIQEIYKLKYTLDR